MSDLNAQPKDALEEIEASTHALIVQPAVHNFLTGRPARHQRTDDGLFVGDIGNHPAKYIPRLEDGTGLEFEPEILKMMDDGTRLEPLFVDSMKFAQGGVVTQLSLGNDIWRGYVDIVLGHGTKDVTLIEIKTTSQFFDYKNSLPRDSHVMQLWLYGQLYFEMFGIRPKLVIHISAREQWAEFQIIDEPEINTVVCKGAVFKRNPARQTKAMKLAGIKPPKYLLQEGLIRTKNFNPHWYRLEAEKVNETRQIPTHALNLDPDGFDYVADTQTALGALYGETNPF